MATVLNLLGHWRMPAASESALETADVVLTHEFGDQRHMSNTTRSIATAGALLAKRLNKPLICQYPGDTVAKELGITPALVIREHLLKKGEYLDTEEVNRQVAAFCRVNGWKRAILITHPHHLWRATENLRHFGLIPIIADVRNVGYDPELKASRPVLATPLLFVPREILARAMYLRKGWI